MCPDEPANPAALERSGILSENAGNNQEIESFFSALTKLSYDNLGEVAEFAAKIPNQTVII